MYLHEVNYDAVRRNFIEFQKPITNRSLSLNQKINLQRKRLNFLADFSNVLKLNRATKGRVLGQARRYLNALEETRRVSLARQLVRPPKSIPRTFTPTTVATLVGNNTPRRSTPSPKQSKKKTAKTYLKKVYKRLRGKK